MPISRALNHDLFKRWSPAIAYVLGYIAADGAITIGKRGNCYLDIESIDQETLALIRQILGANHAITSRKRSTTHHHTYRLQIGSKKIVADLKGLGMEPHKARRLPFPCIPKFYLNHFVRGYFDGDGGVFFGVYPRKNRPSLGKHLQTTFTSCSNPFLRVLKQKLTECAHIRRGSFYRSGGAYRLLYAGRDSIRLHAFMYNKKKCLYLKRKYKYFTMAIRKFLKT